MTGKSTLRRTLSAGAAATAAMVVLFPQAAQAGGIDPIVVDPYEPVVVNDRFVMGLLPEGEQNYVVSTPEDFAEDIEAAKDYPGSTILPNSVATGLYGEDDVIVLVEGVWRLDEGVPQIVVAPEGDPLSYGAQTVTLRNEDGWGTFYFDPSAWEAVATDTYTITAYDTDGEVFSEYEVSLSH
mgnify:CR=1 FL=1